MSLSGAYIKATGGRRPGTDKSAGSEHKAVSIRHTIALARRCDALKLRWEPATGPSAASDRGGASSSHTCRSAQHATRPSVPSADETARIDDDRHHRRTDVRGNRPPPAATRVSCRHPRD
jgi:hypothetical protein